MSDIHCIRMQICDNDIMSFPPSKKCVKHLQKCLLVISRIQRLQYNDEDNCSVNHAVLHYISYPALSIPSVDMFTSPVIGGNNVQIRLK